mgnify:CR=1 FL=1
MKIKKSFFIALMTLLGITFFLSAGLAAMEKVDEKELAGTNASVVVIPLQNKGSAIERIPSWQDTASTPATAEKGDAFTSQGVKGMEGLGISLNVKGQETFKFQVGGVSTITTGGVTHVKSW